MKQYIGVKIVKAEPMTLSDFNRLHDRVAPAAVQEQGYKVEYEDGYISWSPKSVFEKAYRETSDMSFGLALEALQMGKRVTRRGWNQITAPVLRLKNDNEIVLDRNRHPASKYEPTTHQDMLALDWYIL